MIGIDQSSSTNATDTPKFLFARLAGFYAFYFPIIGVLTPFLPLWLQSRGLTSGEIGTVFAVALIAKLFAEPVLSRSADVFVGARRLMIALSGLAVLGYLVLSQAIGFWQIVLASALASVLLHPILPLGESVVLRAVAKSGHAYGKIRLWGSITFIAASVGGGAWLTGRSEDWVLYLVMGLCAVLFVACLLMPDQKTAAKNRNFFAALGLLKDRTYLLFLAAAGASYASHGVYYGFSSIEWRRVGFSEDVIGMFWGIGVVAEIILFAVADKFRFLRNPVNLLLLGLLGGVVRWAAMPAFETLLPTAVLQVLHGLTFGATHLGAMGFLSRFLPDDLAASGQGLFYAFSGGLVMGVIMPVSGWLYGQTGAESYYVMAAISAAGIVAAAALMAKSRSG